MGRYATAAGGGKDFEQAPAGSHVARCIKIIDLGTQESEYQGVKTIKNQILVSWEPIHYPRKPIFVVCLSHGVGVILQMKNWLSSTLNLSWVRRAFFRLSIIQKRRQ